MGLFSKIKKTVTRAGKDFGVIERSKKPQAGPADPDPINPLTGRPMSQNAPSDPYAGGFQGLGQMPPISYQNPPVSMAQRVPQGLGSDVFRSTLAPLQQQGYGLGQIDPRLLTGTVRFPGGSVTPQMQMPPQMPPQMQQAQQGQMPQQFGLGRFPGMFM